MRRSIVCLLLLFFVAASFGQALSDKVPADAILYIGWSGTKDMGPDYNGSHLKAILDQSNLPAVFSDLYPRLTSFAQTKNPDVANVLRAVESVASPLWRYPVAIYFSGLDFEAKGGPIPKIGILCDAGTEAESLRQQLALALDSAGRMPTKIDAFAQGSIVGLTIGIDPPQSVVAAQGAPNLAASTSFISAMKQLGPHPMATVYLDVPRCAALIDQAIAHAKNPDVSQAWAKIRDAAQFDGVHSFAATSGFDGRDWISNAFIDAPEPRKGLAASLADPVPISRDLLATVPQNTLSLSAARFDLAGAVTSLRSLLGQINPEAQKVFDQVLGGAQMMVGKNIVNDILAPLGDEWAVYCAPEIGGGGIFGTVIVNKLRDPKKAQQSLPALSVAISNLTTSGIRLAENASHTPPSERLDIQLSVRTVKIGDVSVTYFALPFISPAWAIRDGYLYLGLYPQTTASAAQFGSSHAPSILDNPKFNALLDRLGNKTPAAVSYVDLPALSGPGYQAILAYSRLGLGIADIFGVPSPEPVIPPYSVILANLTTTGSISWTDAAGWHSRDISPFPGAEILGTQESGGGLEAIGYMATMTSVMLPSLNRARETANRVKCAANERQIGQAILLYSNENKFKYPPDLGSLLVEDISMDVFLCPDTEQHAPDDLTKPEDRAAWVNEHSDYVYVGKGMTSSAPAEQIVLYERPGNHDNDGLNILFADGHVEFCTMPMAVKMITEQNKTVPGVDLPGGAASKAPATPRRRRTGGGL